MFNNAGHCERERVQSFFFSWWLVLYSFFFLISPNFSLRNSSKRIKQRTRNELLENRKERRSADMKICAPAWETGHALTGAPKSSCYCKKKRQRHLFVFFSATTSLELFFLFCFEKKKSLMDLLKDNHTAFENISRNIF